MASVPRPAAVALLTLWSFLQAASVAAQETSAPAAPPPASLPDPLRLCKEGLLDKEARDVERSRWASQLYTYDSPEAIALAAELLGRSDRPGVQRALCGALLDRARAANVHVDPTLTLPLLDLLGAEDEGLRRAAGEVLGALLDTARVAGLLDELASQPDTPLRQRLAAIDSLTINVHNSDVVAELIALMDPGTPPVATRIIAALEPIAGAGFGGDVARWKEWWSDKSDLTPRQWAEEQLQLSQSRLRVLRRQLDASRQDCGAREVDLAARLTAFQRDVFRTLNDQQRNAALVGWLGEPLDEVKLCALSLIKSRISDEGLRPEAEMLGALLEVLERGSSGLRQEVLPIVQNLNDAAVLPTVLGLLEGEADPATRHAIFKAIGKLDRPEAIPDLIREIGNAGATTDCVREAAIALGKIAPRAGASEPMGDVIEALKARYAIAPATDTALRAALLGAMAGVGDPSFASELLGAVETDEPVLVQPAIQGLLAIGDRSKLARLRDLTDHADPRVRLAAIEALGTLGREDADLESLLPRLSRARESNEAARNAAWLAFRRLIERQNRPLVERIQASQRLRGLPELEIEYLEGLLDGLSTGNGQTPELHAIRHRLGTIHSDQGNHSQAAAEYRELYRSLAATGHRDAVEQGQRWLSSALRAKDLTGLGGVVDELMAARNAALIDGIVETVQTYLESEPPVGDPARALAVLAEIRSVTTDPLPPAWVVLLDRTAARLVAAPEGADETTTDTVESPAP